MKTSELFVDEMTESQAALLLVRDVVREEVQNQVQLIVQGMVNSSSGGNANSFKLLIELLNIPDPKQRIKQSSVALALAEEQPWTAENAIEGELAEATDVDASEQQ